MARNPRPSEVAHRLDRAAGYIEKHGWTRGVAQDVNGHVCALGGIWLSGKSSNVETYADAAFEAMIRAEYGTGTAQWNDAQTDRRKVTRALRRAARKVRDRKLVVVGHDSWPKYTVR